jgi:phosphopantothenoylcysteine decarboxylase/phosphopantothenate--cysteine ligase
VAAVMTKEAEKFITPLTLAGLCGQKVYRDMFEDDQSLSMPHIALAQQADVFLIAPATANVIGKIAGGLADDLLTCIALATKAKIIIAPAMNDGMYQNKIVQQNISKLKNLGIKFVEPTKGHLACGTFGEGHLAEIDDILKAVAKVV